MALESPLVNSPANIMSAFSPYTEFSLSPNSPALPHTPRFQSLSARSSAEASSLQPTAVEGGLSPAVQVTSPSDMVGPSPVTSNGTETTEIEDDASEEVEEEKSSAASTEKQRADTPLNTLATNLSAQIRNKPDDEPSSVIHAPQGYMEFANTKNTNPPQISPPIDRSTPKPFQASPPSQLRVALSSSDEAVPSGPLSPPPISTDIDLPHAGLDNTTPKAQTRQELEMGLVEKTRIRSSSANSLEGEKAPRNNLAVTYEGPGIPEDYRESDENVDLSAAFPPQDPQEEINALKAALHECWTLCNTLASLSSIHRERIFSHSGTGDAHEKAWKCCWMLCQKLYDSRDDEHDLHVTSTLDLCREFCQALFDVRQRNDEIADGILRVSFELNNHLFNTHDRNLPEAFRERTLDFYITLCHRLMKQRSELAEETDSLLRACWSLAEMLFSLRQNRREERTTDEELIGSAVQACWELCDLFREGWTQVRPERGTPRPSQTTFTQSFDQLSRSSHHPSSSISSLPSLIERVEPRHIEPETPTTEFEDTPVSPEEQSPSIPNILVLGTEISSGRARWSSNSSNLSGYSQGSNKTSSTIKTATGSEDVNLTRLKILILKAALNVGFKRTQPPTSGSATGANTLQSYVRTLPPGSFGTLQWHSSLLTSYKDLVLSDPTFRNAATLPAQGKRASALDIAKSIRWMMKSGQYLWLEDLFRLVFGFRVEEAEKRKTVGITV